MKMKCYCIDCKKITVIDSNEKTFACSTQECQISGGMLMLTNFPVNEIIPQFSIFQKPLKFLSENQYNFQLKELAQSVFKKSHKLNY